MATVELALAAIPAHVRTARLVAVSLARRAGLEEDDLDEVRLAVGEATSRAVGLHVVTCPQESVRIRFSDDEAGIFLIEVIDRAPSADPDLDNGPDQNRHDLALAALAEHGDALDDSDVGVLPPAVGLAVIDGIVDDVSVRHEGTGSTVRLAWAIPLAPHPSLPAQP